MQALLDPTESGSVNQWRSDINRRLIALLAADSAGFILPVADGPVIYSDEHDAAALAQYPEMAPPLLTSGQSIFARGVELGVSTLEDAWGAEMQRNLSSAYHNEYLVPNRAFDALSAVLAVPQLGPHGMAGVQLWHDSSTGRKFGDRERSLLRVIFPALRTGIEARLRWERHHADLFAVIDDLAQPVLLFDAFGKPLHQTPAFVAEMRSEPQCAVVHEAIAKIVAAFGRLGTGVHMVGPLPRLEGSSVSTSRATYRLSGSLFRSPLPTAPMLVIVSLERLTRVPLSDVELLERFRLSRAELRVAALLVTRKSSTEIAREVNLSPHTVRRHCESILLKTGTGSRVELAALLLR